MSKSYSKFDGNRTDWVTPNSVPTPKDLPQMKGWNILIRPFEPVKEIKFSGGKSLLTPDSYQEDQRLLNNVGEVVAMGNLCYTDNDGSNNPHGKYKQPWCKVGDYVVWGKHQGAKIEIKGIVYVVLADELVLMTLSDPLDINPQVNFKGKE